jgi:SWIM zinc finger/Transposase DDE domain
MEPREQRGLVIAATAKIEFRRTYFLVPSCSNNGCYKVDWEATNCTCPDFELRQVACKHVFAVRLVKRRDYSTEKLEIEVPLEQPGSRRKTYPQNWPKYNLAQTREKGLFLQLLGNLCNEIDWMPRPGRGRPTLPYDAAIFSAVYKVYSGFSGRRFQTDMNDARDAGLIHTAPHYNSIAKTLEDPNTTKTLKELVVKSSLPLRVIESKFAVDSTGFSTNKFARWFDEKYGTEKKKAEWIKVHAMIGVQTNVVCSCEISDAHDSTLYKQLVS